MRSTITWRCTNRDCRATMATDGPIADVPLHRCEVCDRPMVVDHVDLETGP
jgi:hypothetical protein